MNNRTRSKWSSPWAFFALTYALTWLFWIPAALTGRSIGEFPVTLLIALGGICPAVCGISLTRLTRDKAGWRDYWRRVIDFRRIGARWYAVIFLLVDQFGEAAFAWAMVAYMVLTVGGTALRAVVDINQRERIDSQSEALA